MMTLEQTILSILSNTDLSYMNKPLNQLAVKPTISIEGQKLCIELKSGFPHQDLQIQIQDKLINTLKKALPDYKISLVFKTGIRSHQTQMPGSSLKNVKNVIAVASGKGGVGKSTVCINLAVALAKKGARVGVLDADIYGPSIPTMLGQPHAVQLDNEKYIPIQAHGIQAMSIGYLTKDEPALIWRGPMLAKSMIQMLDITLWDNLDYLFIDLPPGTGDIQLSLVQKIPLTGAIIVSTPQTVATLDAEKGVKMFNKTNIQVLGMIENMSTHVCSNCEHEDHIFGHGGVEKIANLYQVPLLGKLPLNSQIVYDCDNAHPTTTKPSSLSKPFEQAAMQLAISLSEMPLNYMDKLPPVSLK